VKAKLRYDDAAKAARQAQTAYAIARQESAAALRGASDATADAADAENTAESGIAFQTHNDFMLSKEDLSNKEELYKNARTASTNATTSKQDSETALAAAKNAQAAAQAAVDAQQKVTDDAQADAVEKEKTSSSLLDTEQGDGKVGEESVDEAKTRSDKVAEAEAAATQAEEKAKDEAQKLAQLKSVLAEKKLETANAETVKANCIKDEADAKAESNQKEQEYLEAAHQHALIEVSAQHEARRAEADIYNSSMTMAEKSIAATNAEKASSDAQAFSELKDSEETAAADTLAKAQASAAVAAANLATRRDTYILAVKVAFSTSLQTTGTIHVVGASEEYTGVSVAAAPAAGPTAAASA